MSISTIQVRDVGTYGFDVTPLSGLGLSAAEADATRSQVDDALALAGAIREALEAAREAGVADFKPTDAELTLPAGLSASSRDFLFQNVIGRAYSGGTLRLQDWSQAVDALDHWAAAQASMLPPGAGGGSRNVQGTWYVNGLPWTLSELFTVNRVNTLAEIDRMVAESLNVIAANNDAAKALTGLMQKMFRKYYDNQWDGTQQDGNGTTYRPFQRISQTWVDAVGRFDQDAPGLAAADPDRHPWTEGSEVFLDTDGAPELEYPMSFSQLLAYADKYIGPTSMIRLMAESGTTEGWNAEPDIGLGKDDFRAMIDEIETIVGAFSSDNQVAQLRNETLFNSRSNLLEGLSTFLKGQQTTGSTLARNT